jgi:hypothetical protein
MMERTVTTENLEWLLVSVIDANDDVQARCELSVETVAMYRDLLSDGATFPPIDVFYDGEIYWLADGFHRIAATRDAGKDRIAAHIRQGTRREAALFSVTSNANRGKPFTAADKHRAVLRLLQDEEWGQWSDGVIARKCGVSQPFVSKLRRRLLESTQNGIESARRRTADGRLMDTMQIGVRRRDYVDANAPEAIQRRVDMGELSLVSAEAITRTLTHVSPLVRDLALLHDVRDEALIMEIERLYRDKSETFASIAASGYIQGSGEPIALRDANLANLRTVLDEAQREHIMEAVERKREAQVTLVSWQAAIVEATDEDRVTLAFATPLPQMQPGQQVKVTIVEEKHVPR